MDSDQPKEEITVYIEDIKNGILPFHMMMQHSIEATKMLDKMRNNMPTIGPAVTDTDNE